MNQEQESRAPESEVLRQEQLAANGDQEAEFFLGALYASSGAGALSRIKAKYWYRRAAQKGHVEAMYRLGCLLYETEPGLAAEWFQKAADMQHLKAAYRIGCCYRDGIGIRENAPLAQAYMQLAAKGGEIPACFALGKLLENLSGNESAACWYERALQGGELLALAPFLRTRPNMPDEQTLSLLRQYAYRLKQSNHTSALDVAVEQLTERLIKESSPDMASLLLRLWEEFVAEQQVGKLPQKLLQGVASRLLEEGDRLARPTDGVSRIRQAVPYYEQAAKTGNALAQFKLAMCCMGSVTDELPPDRNRGLKLLYKSAWGGYPYASYYYAQSLAETGKASDAEGYYSKAYQGLRGLAKEGDGKAQKQVALQLREGKGVQRDVIAAWDWLLLLAKKDELLAADALAAFPDAVYQELLHELRQLDQETLPDPARQFDCLRQMAALYERELTLIEEEAQSDAARREPRFRFKKTLIGQQLFRLSCCYNEGIGCEQNKTEALQLCYWAKECGDPDALGEFGRIDRMLSQRNRSGLGDLYKAMSKGRRRSAAELAQELSRLEAGKAPHRSGDGASGVKKIERL